MSDMYKAVKEILESGEEVSLSELTKRLKVSRSTIINVIDQLSVDYELPYVVYEDDEHCIYGITMKGCI